MNHIPFTPTDFQRGNLLRLAAHLDLGVTNLEFDMAEYSDEPNLHECGTVGCAIGHGPSLGIAVGESNTWGEYALRVFGCEGLVGCSSANAAFFWMFGSVWSCTDNSPRGAAARIYYALKHGIPENFYSQMRGDAPLSYTVPERVEGPVVAAKVTT